MKKNGEVTAWTEHPEGMPMHAVVRVGNDLYTFEKFDRRPATKLGDGVSSEIRRQEGHLKGRRTVADKRTARLDAREAKLDQREKLLEERMKRSRKLTAAGDWEARMERLQKRLRRQELTVTERERDAEAVTEEALAASAAAHKARMKAETALSEASTIAWLAAEDKLKKAVERVRDEAEEARGRANAVLKHLEDKLAEVRKKEELLDRRLEAMTNLMCGNVQDALEGIR